MVTETNFHMLRNLKFKPKNFGVLSRDEVDILKEHFQMDERSNIDLQNLRDFVVMYFSGKTRDDLEAYDLMSGIIGVIDEEKWIRGMEI